MQNYCKTIGALAAASALVAGNAKAELEDIDYNINAGYSSSYVFRGLQLGDNLTELSLNAATEWNGVKFSSGLWAAAFNNTGTTNDVDHEVDFYAQVGKDFGFATLSVGYIYYWNVGKFGPDTQEVPFTISRDFGFMNAYASYFWDVDGDNDGYSEIGGSKSWELSPCLNLNLSSNIGYLVEQGYCTAWTTKLALDWGFSENAKLSPFVSYAVSIDYGHYSLRGATADDEFVAGSMLSVSF